jgi:heme/copper-type cytochrome/quinol oxidase subunit 2
MIEVNENILLTMFIMSIIALILFNMLVYSFKKQLKEKQEVIDDLLKTLNKTNETHEFINNTMLKLKAIKENK